MTVSAFMDATTPHPSAALTVDLSAIAHNFQVARRTVNRAQVWPVVKANGYGLGAQQVALRLQQEGADGFCVALPEEAALLRAVGIDRPMVLLSGVPVGWEAQAAALGVQPFLFSLADGQRLSAAASSRHPFQVHVKVDTGMARLGVAPEEVSELLRALDQLPGLRVCGIVSHLACSDEPELAINGQQVARFRSVLALPEVAKRGLTASLANSGGVLGNPASHFDWVRPGIMLYGASPFFPGADWQAAGLRPVVRWTTHVVQVRTVQAGTPLGYSHTYVARQPSRIAQIRIGYADSYSRRLGNRGWVLLHGQRAPVVGRVCMDLVAVDVTAIPETQPNDLVTLLGGDGNEFIGIEEMATWMETIPYEVICRHSTRDERLYCS